MLADALGERRQVVQYHWGGGTPTYLSPAQIAALQAVVGEHFDIRDGAEVAIEVDPRVTSVEQLALLRDLGFNRLSLGVQDFTPEVQAAVNRIQSRAAHANAVRRRPRPRVRVDQRGPDLRAAAADARDVRRDRRRRRGDAARPRRRLLATRTCRGFAGIRRYLNPDDLPGGRAQDRAVRRSDGARSGPPATRRLAWTTSRCRPTNWPSPPRRGRLHRNFMGYTTRPAPDMLAAGVSGIGDVGGAFAQNTKKLSDTTPRSTRGASRSSADTGSTETITSAGWSSPAHVQLPHRSARRRTRGSQSSSRPTSGRSSASSAESAVRRRLRHD